MEDSFSQEKGIKILAALLIFAALLFVFSAKQYFSAAYAWNVSDTDKSQPAQEEYPIAAQGEKPSAEENKPAEEAKAAPARISSSMIFRKIARKAKTACLSGDFNGWKEEQMSKT